MGLPAFDTHAFVKRLKLVGFSDEQAEAQAELQSEILSSLMSEKLATKDDIKHLDDKIISTSASLRQDIAALSVSLRQEMAALSAETKQDALALSTSSLKQEMAALAAEMKQGFIRQDEKINKMEIKFNGKFNQLYWMISFLLAANMTILYKIFHL